ncbi:MAG: Asp-tRNA(Asn)/Glu-tRNA(Gln) amidotransferase subunit GatC [Peptococcaceae bacterium]|nr:Asp-tRNA(Asn)/Glu-tRNA(Gln) amidotransferase subunit GatC [Peptococcaceae bacterium]
MRIKAEDVEKLALMSRLELTEEEKAAYTESLNASLNYLDKLTRLVTDTVEPATHVLPIVNIFREDRIETGLDQELVLANAPEVEAGSFKVPRIV